MLAPCSLTNQHWRPIDYTHMSTVFPNFWWSQCIYRATTLTRKSITDDLDPKLGCAWEIQNPGPKQIQKHVKGKRHCNSVSNKACPSWESNAVQDYPVDDSTAFVLTAQKASVGLEMHHKRCCTLILHRPENGMKQFINIWARNGYFHVYAHWRCHNLQLTQCCHLSYLALLANIKDTKNRQNHSLILKSFKYSGR
jgi:hypothetical protein